MEFLGVVIFQDPLKPNVKKVIKSLERNDIYTMIITGDDKYNALNVAMNSEMIPKNSSFFLGYKDKSEIRFGYYSNTEVINKLYSNRNIPNIEASILES